MLIISRVGQDSAAKLLNAAKSGDVKVAVTITSAYIRLT